MIERHIAAQGGACSKALLCSFTSPFHRPSPSSLHCDGVIVETEELHRKAYNAAFADFKCEINGQPLVWTVEYYVSHADGVGAVLDIVCQWHARDI